MNEPKGIPAPIEPKILPAVDGVDELLPLLAGHATPALAEKTERFFFNLEKIFEAWVQRRKSPHTQRAYRRGVMNFADFMGWETGTNADGQPTLNGRDGWRIFTTNVPEVLAWRDFMASELDQAPKTVNHRLSSLAAFFKYLAGVAGVERLPINIPNPAHVQFVERLQDSARNPHLALSATRARQLMGYPKTESVIDYRDRAMLKTLLYTALRIGTLERLDINDLATHGEEFTLRIRERGGKRRTIGIHFAAGEAIQQYIDAAGITAGPLFRAKQSRHSEDVLTDRRMSAYTLWETIKLYLSKLPGSLVAVSEDSNEKKCKFTPHSLRATAATLLLDSGVEMKKVQVLLGHKHISTTQIYDKRRIEISDSASHDMPL